MDRVEANYVFGLDIGTRTCVGTVGYQEDDGAFVVVAQVIKEHTTRAVLEGQIHDVVAVTQMVKDIKEQLEEQTGEELKFVSIAAAGRVLETRKVVVTQDLPEETVVTKDHIHSLDSLAVSKAYEEMGGEHQFYCVGYSVIDYYLNGYSMSTIESHKANKIGVEIMATFLPDEVVNSLYMAVEQAGLKVINLTLEPLAAIRVAIPENFRLLNIALLDVGAGTSDISIARDGGIVAFGMMPLAGDEITEAIARNYLIDFKQAEHVKTSIHKKKKMSFKDIMGTKVSVTKEDIEAVTREAIEAITTKIADKIIEINGGKTVSAVFVIGGGGKMPGFVEGLTEHLGLPEGRVAIRGAEVLKDVRFIPEGIRKDSTLVTPIGICLSYYDENNRFIQVSVNGEMIKLFDTHQTTVMDAVIQAGFGKESIFPVRGKKLTFTIDGTERVINGSSGSPGVVKCNGKVTSLNELVHQYDQIEIKVATKGMDAHIMTGDLVNLSADEQLEYILVNGDEVSENTPVREGDEVIIRTSIIRKEPKIEVKTVEQHVDNKSDQGIFVSVNAQPVELKGKDSYIFVDILDVYPFDLSQAKGVRLKTTVNGMACDFTKDIHDGDIVEMIWEG